MKKIALYISLIILVSCLPKNEIGIDNTDLIGNWSWTETSGGIAAHIHETPDSVGKNYVLKLSNNYTFSILENGTEISKGRYELKWVESIYNHKMERFITLQPDKLVSDSQMVLFGIINTTENNTVLNIDDNNYDGLGSSFKKII